MKMTDEQFEFVSSKLTEILEAMDKVVDVLEEDATT